MITTTKKAWARQIFQGVEPGAQVLDELEFGAGKTLDMHLEFLKSGHRMLEDYGVREYCAIGSQTLDELKAVPIRYVKEDSADNTVRTSACNLNFNHIVVKPTKAAKTIDLKIAEKEMHKRLEGDEVSNEWYEFDLSGLAASRKRVPFAVVYNTAHFGEDLGIVSGKKTRSTVLPLLKEALAAPHDDAAYEKIAERWEAVTRRTLTRASRLKGRFFEWNRRKQYEGHSQLIFRLRDQNGLDVENYDITFNSSDRGSDQKLEWMIEDNHRNRFHPGTRVYYLRTQKFSKHEPYELKDRLDTVRPLEFEITGYEPRTERIQYLPLRVRVIASTLRKMIQPFRTTLVDVTLMRLPTSDVFVLKKA